MANKLPHKLSANKLTRDIFIAMAVGLSLGLFLHHMPALDQAWIKHYVTDGVLELGGVMFITSIKILVVPMIMVSMIYAMSHLGNAKNIGRLGAKTLGLHFMTSILAIILAMFFASLFKLGYGLEISPALLGSGEAPTEPSLAQTIISAIPQPVLDILLGRKLLTLIMIALVFGFALNYMGQLGRRIADNVETLNDWILRVLVVLMRFTPYGVFCLTAQSFAVSGVDMVSVLLKYILVMLFVLALHVAIISTVLLRFMSGLSIKIFFQKMRTALLMAFSTASSNVALPLTLDTVKRKLGVSTPIASFTMPLGTTLNMDGGAVLQGMATIFIANYFMVDLTLIDHLTIVIAALIATIGTAGVPSVGPVMLVFVLHWMGLPLEGVGLILGVDRLLEMFRTAVNVTGDAMIACAVAKSEGGLNTCIYEAPELNDEVLCCAEPYDKDSVSVSSQSQLESNIDKPA